MWGAGETPPSHGLLFPIDASKNKSEKQLYKPQGPKMDKKRNLNRRKLSLHTNLHQANAANQVI